jgi:CRISPR-associated protein Cas1
LRRMLNVLYVTTPHSYLVKDGENIVIKVDNEIRFRIPSHNLESIVCLGCIGASPALMGFCAQRGIALSFHTESGRFLARVTGAVSGNVLLRRQQYRIADSDILSLAISINCITGKIANCRTILQRALRDHADTINSDKIRKAVSELGEHIKNLNRCDSLDTLRGIEGDAARKYFNAFDELILDQKDAFYMNERSKHPPLDLVNSLLSFLYALLTHDVQAALESVGLDPAVGFLHRDRPGRPSLALDLMEELRPFLADRLCLTLINRRQVLPSGFKKKESGGILMNDDTRKTVISSWQKRKQEEITHPYLNEKIPVGLIPYTQAILLARYIRGDIDEYPPFIWR